MISRKYKQQPVSEVGMLVWHSESLGQIVSWQPSLSDTQVIWGNNACKICMPGLNFNAIELSEEQLGTWLPYMWVYMCINR